MDDSGFHALVAGLLEESHHTAPEDIARLLRDVALAMGLQGADVYLADVQQTHLVPLDVQVPRLGVEGTLAGRAYSTQTPQTGTDPACLWLPLIDGVERIGVLRLTGTGTAVPDLAHGRTLASVTALLVVSKSTFSDTLQRRVRTRPMTLQAELAWAFTPPRTVGTRAVTSSAVMEPAYEIGGDAFDHALGERRLHLAVVDAMGHDAASGLSAALALAGCRSTRRRGRRLTDIAGAVDRTLTRWVPERLLTAVFADLDVATGRFSWVNCGHPAPLLIRNQHIVAGALTREANLPLGLGPHPAWTPPALHHAQLEPGDQILIHTDGVTEARSEEGELFGEERLVDTVIRAVAAGQPAPEALRRLIRAILGHQNGHLMDDATILLAEWHPRT
ncbi:PP2C family protein-serine/threonine phosphatase [Streptomyces sp. NPDC059442]|uniref:PP2C family protein-serine/threonine phosphatase n=1 Tax=Streptomyces sp. NPDC059442 TaxID=3346830 RepID=UPI00367A60AB